MKYKIVIIDDDKEFLEEFGEIFGLYGYEIYTFDNGISALQELEDIIPNLILLDLKMDGLNGFEVAMQVKQDKRISHVPIFAMTGFFDDNICQEYINNNIFLECFSKPLSPEKVLDKIQKLLA